MKTIFLLSFAFSSIIYSYAQSNDIASRQKTFNIESNVAIQGYDPVSYFKVGKAKKGSKSFQTNYKGIVYQFVDAANLEAFKKEPEKYEPAFGGWCAYAMGQTGEKVEIDPETFKLIDNKLYLFYNAYFNNTLPKWNADQANLKKKAEQNWSKLVK